MARSFDELLRLARTWVDERYLQLRPSFGWDSHLTSQVDHVFLGAGKAFRPALLCWSWSQLEGSDARPPEHVLDAALALEFIHTYSLVHDDLPAMDNDDFRRGKPTLHRLHTEADAILAGDALLTSAFEILARDASHGSWRLASVALLARAAGGAGMVGGQYDDIHQRPDLENLHRKKTGALIAVSTEIGALAASRRKAAGEAYRSFGSDLGLYFQIVDDLLDELEGTGKTAGKDARAGKTTFASDPAAAKARLNALETHLKSSAPSLGFDTTAVESLLSFLANRKS